MTELLTAAQMRAIEQTAIDSGEVTGLELMERAGRGVVEAIFEEWPELAKTDHRAVVLCGPGNNGGDGFVVARLLKEWGWEVEVFLYGNADKLPADAKVNYERWLALGEARALIDDNFDGYPDEEHRVSIVIDALFGTGLTRPYLNHPKLQMQLNYCQSVSKQDSKLPHIVSIDVPSGMCADSGIHLGDDQPVDFAISSNLTVSFHSEKLAHRLDIAPIFCTKVKVVNIGLQKDCKDMVATLTSFPKHFGKSPSRNKYSHGHAFILSGPTTRTGAARLAASGALRIGAGVVTIATPKDALAEHAAQLNAVMLTKVDGVGNFTKIIKDERINALCVGPAFGLKPDRAKLLKAILETNRATVIDADALTLISKDTVLFDLLHDKCVLTPHGGEFTRLFPDLAEKLNATPTKGPAYSKVDASREAAKRAGCVVLFKGPDTVIAAPDGRCSINSAHYERAAPWLATAGSGDVLAGFITGLLARGFDPMRAAETAAWLHVECALNFGPGLIAEDLPEQLPKVFQDLGL